jgi:hypothetical protein
MFVAQYALSRSDPAVEVSALAAADHHTVQVGDAWSSMYTL